MGQRDRMFKVLVVGDATVGKTSLVQRYANDSFNRHYKSTVGGERGSGGGWGWGWDWDGVPIAAAVGAPRCSTALPTRCGFGGVPARLPAVRPPV